jgi:hypothetical protein
MPILHRRHTKAALRHGFTRQELMGSDLGCREMRAGGAYAHAAFSLMATDKAENRPGS